MKYSFDIGLQIVLLISVLIAVSYILKLVRDTIQNNNNIEDFESRIDPVVPNQLRYWGDRKKGIVQEYEGEKFLELDAQGDLKLTSRDETYKRYLGAGENPNYYGPLKKDGVYVAVEGHNLSVLNNISLEQCKTRCDRLDNCQGIAYKESDNKCTLEKYSCANAPKDCVSSKEWRAYEKLETNDKLIEADKVQSDFSDVQQDMTILGHNVKHIKSTTLKNCLNTCHKNPQCAAASFRRGECFHESKTCKEAGKACVRGEKANGWQMFELGNTVAKGGSKNQYYPVRIGGKRASINGYNLKNIKAPSLDKCIKECDKISKCKGVEYKGKKCHLSSGICRSVGSKCQNDKKWDAYEKNKYLGPYFIKTRWNYGSKPYLAMKQSKSRGVPLIMTNKTDKYSKWIMHPDGSIQNVGTELFISYSGSLNPGKKLISGITRRRWVFDKSAGRSWKPTYWAGLIYYMKNKKYFIYVNRNFNVTMEVESKSGRRKNPDYKTCKRQGGGTSTSGKKYLRNGKTVDKTHWQAQWSLKKTSY